MAIPVEYIVRNAQKADCRPILNLIQELANFEKMPDGPRLTEKDLMRDGFESSPPLFRCIVAERNGSLIGYCLFYYIYSTWQGKSMYIEDLYITPNCRKHGVGSKLFYEVVTICYGEGCARLDFEVLGWNPARKFYEKHGAVNLTKEEDWHRHRMSRTSMQKLMNISVDNEWDLTQERIEDTSE